jgi:hypothetical protein
MMHNNNKTKLALTWLVALVAVGWLVHVAALPRTLVVVGLRWFLAALLALPCARWLARSLPCLACRVGWLVGWLVGCWLDCRCSMTMCQ